MRFESQCFWLAKDAEFPDQYQDAYQLDARRGIAAIADGVSSALFSGPWARTLVRGALAEPPPLDDADCFRDWLTRQRTELAGQIDVTKLTWYQRPKFAAGAMSTLLWIELTPQSPETPETPELPSAYRLQGYSIGDCCLFHLRDGQLLRSFPMSGSAEFGLDPKVLVSIDRQQDHLLEFQQFDDACLPGDLLVLCTDAIGLWALTLLEQGEQVAWDAYWDRSPEAWAEEIFELRRGKQMRYDDTTLMLLRIIEETTGLEAAATPSKPAIETLPDETLSDEIVVNENTQDEIAPVETAAAETAPHETVVSDVPDIGVVEIDAIAEESSSDRNSGPTVKDLSATPTTTEPERVADAREAPADERE